MDNRRNFFRMLGFVRPHAFMYGLGLFVYNIQGFAFAALNSFLLGGVTAGILARDFDAVARTIAIMGGALAGVFVALGFGVYAYVVATAYGVRDFKMRIFRSYMKSSIEGEKHSGEGIAAINTDADAAANVFSDAVSQVARAAISIAFSLAMLFALEWRIGLGALAIGAACYFAQSRFMGPLARIGKERLAANAESVKSVSNILSGALTIRAFSRQDRAFVLFDREAGKLKVLGFREAAVNAWRGVFQTLQGWLSLALVFGLGGWLVARDAAAGAEGGLEFHIVFMAFPLVAAVGEAASGIGASFAGLMAPLEAAKRCLAIIDAGADPAKTQAESGEKWNGKCDIALEGLCFRYKGACEDALRDVSLSIKENTMVAFVGASGSGKSTLLRAIIGMYERDGLGLRLGDLPFGAGETKGWRRHFAYVDQSCKLFDMSIEENILLGGGALAAEDAARRAFAHDFIAGLPDGYATQCGEKGASLSGGQKQRIAIARALQRQAPVLVFDEATSALDAESEAAVMDTIQKLRGGHTILLTTHSLPSIRNADMIVVMDGGEIAETGTHDELLARGGKYAALLG